MTYGQIVKHYGVQGGVVEAARRYSPAQVVSVSKRRVVGRPKHISTSYIERQNLTLRMQQRRFTRLTNAFSKKLENHEAAVALYVAHYNLCRVHETLRVTPAMQLGVTDHIWSIGELVDAALDGMTPAASGPQGRSVPRNRWWALASHGAGNLFHERLILIMQEISVLRPLACTSRICSSMYFWRFHVALWL